MRSRQLDPVFVTYIPAQLRSGHVYVSMEYATAVHLCACGCGAKTVTPLAADGWTLKFDGSVTLRPSIGNGQSPCKSHYLITRDTVSYTHLDVYKRQPLRCVLHLLGEPA